MKVFNDFFILPDTLEKSKFSQEIFVYKVQFSDIIKIKMVKGSNKCNICGKSGSKGWFGIPKNEEIARKWVQVIGSATEDNEVPKSAKACFRHFSVTELFIYPDLVKPKPGKKMLETCK